MISRRHYLTGLLAAAALFAVAPAEAHRQPVTFSTIEPLENGRLGITHRLHAHDAVRILALDPEVTQPSLEGLKARAKVALYVSKRFQIALTEAGSDPVKTGIIGAELEGDDFYIYQEVDRPLPDATWYLNSTILQELDQGWQSHVNYSFDSEIRTVTYSGKSRWQELER